jgi:hypothetical protein
VQTVIGGFKGKACFVKERTRFSKGKGKNLPHMWEATMIVTKYEYKRRKKLLLSLGYTGDEDKIDAELKEILDKLYNVSRLSSTCIAEIFGVSVWVVRKDMKRLGVLTRGWSNFIKAGASGFHDECVKHRVCIYCQKPFSTIYSKEVTCKDPECKKRFYLRNRKKKSDPYEDFM